MERESAVPGGAAQPRRRAGPGGVDLLFAVILPLLCFWGDPCVLRRSDYIGPFWPLAGEIRLHPLRPAVYAVFALAGAAFLLVSLCPRSAVAPFARGVLLAGAAASFALFLAILPLGALALVGPPIGLLGALALVPLRSAAVYRRVAAGGPAKARLLNPLRTPPPASPGCAGRWLRRSSVALLGSIRLCRRGSPSTRSLRPGPTREPPARLPVLQRWIRRRGRPTPAASGAVLLGILFTAAVAFGALALQKRLFDAAAKELMDPGGRAVDAVLAAIRPFRWALDPEPLRRALFDGGLPEAARPRFRKALELWAGESWFELSAEGAERADAGRCYDPPAAAAHRRSAAGATHAQPPRAREEPLPPAARGEPRRLVPLGG